MADRINEVSVSSAPFINTPASTISSEDLQSMAIRDISSIAATTAGVNQADMGEAMDANSSRAKDNDIYVDGARITGNFSLPASEIESISVVTAGISAEDENDRSQSSTRSINNHE